MKFLCICSRLQRMHGTPAGLSPLTAGSSEVLSTSRQMGSAHLDRERRIPGAGKRLTLEQLEVREWMLPLPLCCLFDDRCACMGSAAAFCDCSGL